MWDREMKKCQQIQIIELPLIKKTGRYTASGTKGSQLLLKPSGTKYQLLRFAFNDKRHELGIGLFPDLLPKQARQIAQEVRTLITKGGNPLTSKIAQKAQRKALKKKE